MEVTECLKKLSAKIKGEINFPEEAVTDFGRTEYKLPPAILKPKSVQDISIALQFANLHNIPVSIKGAAHTTGGQTLTKGIIIDMITLRGKIKINKKEQHVEMYAGEYWHTVIEETLKHHPHTQTGYT